MQTVAILFAALTIEFWLEAVIAKIYYHSQQSFFWIFKRHHFSWWRYFIFFGIPFITVLGFIFRYDRSLSAVLIAFAVVGTALEWAVGYTYHNVMGTKLWTYHRYSIGSYTSWLAMPMWVIAGVLFWSLTRLF